MINFAFNVRSRCWGTIILASLVGMVAFQGPAQAAEITAAEMAKLETLPLGNEPLFEQADPPPPPDRVVPTERVISPAATSTLSPDDVDTSAASLPPWRRYAAYSPELRDGPLVAIVIDDLGHSGHHLNPVFSFDIPLTLAFLPYPAMSRQLAAKARSRGYELLVHMPMEPGDENVDPGPGALTTDLDDDALRKAIVANLNGLEGYVGVNNHMGSKFTRSARSMQIVMEELAARGLLYLDSITTGRSQGWREAEKLRIPYAKRDVFLDNDPLADAVVLQLEQLEARARQYGYAVAIGHPHPETFEAIARWLPGAQERGTEVVPLSTIAALECAC